MFRERNAHGYDINYDKKMQVEENKDSQFTFVLGELLSRIRQESGHLSLSKFADEYDLRKGNLSKIENGKQECKFITLWKYSEALGIKCSKLVQLLEAELGDNFTLIED